MALLGPDGQPTGQPGQPNEPKAPKHVTTAFLVMVEPNGRVSVTDDLTTALSVARKPMFDDILGAAANIQVEVAAQKTATMSARTTVQTQMAIQQQLAEAQHTAQVQQMLAHQGKS